MTLRISMVKTGGLAEGKYRLCLHADHRRSLEEFVSFAAKGELAAGAVRLILDRAAEWILKCAKEGRECDLGPLGRSRLGLPGSFPRPTTALCDEDIKLTINWILARDLKEQVLELGKDLPRVRIISDAHRPVVTETRTYVWRTNEWVTNAWCAGQGLDIVGHRLKFDTRDGKQGVFLRKTGERGPWSRLTHYQTTEPKTVRCLIPDDWKGSGDLDLRVCTRRSGKRDSILNHEFSPLHEMP